MDRLKEILKLQQDPTGGATPLNEETVELIVTAVEDIVEDGKGSNLLTFVAPLVKGKEVGDTLAYAAARGQFVAGDRPIGMRMTAHLCERLEQHKKWDGLRPILERFLEEMPTPEFSRFAARLWEKGGSENAPRALLERAYEIAPEDHKLLWALGQSRIEDSDRTGRKLIAASLPTFAKKKDYDKLEEGVLALVENVDAVEADHILDAITELIKIEEFDRVTTIFEFVTEPFQKHGMGRRVWLILHKHLAKANNDSPLRKIAVRFGPEAYPDLTEPVKLFERTGIADENVPIKEALKNLKKLLELPAGKHVYHHGWGVGQVTDNDGETLLIDFLDKPKHKMSLQLAKTALQFLEATDLRVKMYHDRDGVRRAVSERRPDLLQHVLEHLGGKATRDEIKKQLVHLELLTAQSWADWWKNAKKDAEKDPRFDWTQSFRNVVSLKDGDDAHVHAPDVILAGNFKKSMGLLSNFLDQHPDGLQDVAERYGNEIRNIANNDERPSGLRMLGHVMLYRVGTPDEPGFVDALHALERDPDLGVLATEQQKLLLQVAPDEEQTRAVRLLLTSRILSVRKEAWSLLDVMEPGVRDLIILDLLDESPRCGNAVLFLVKELLESRQDLLVRMMHSIIYLLEEPEKETHRKDAQKLVETPAFKTAIKACELNEAEREFLTNRLAHWKHSERYLFPLLELFSDTPLKDIAAAVEEKRQALRPIAETSILDQFGGRILMTKPTLDRLRKEVEELDWDLKTTIPKMIREARELGDLKENAEYHAAKKKQRDASQRLEQMYERVRLATLIEDMHLPEDAVSPGTEVTVKTSKGEMQTYWVLGEGDGELAPEVVSYRAPIGAALLGKKVGEETEEFNDQTMTITQIRHRLPATAD